MTEAKHWPMRWTPVWGNCNEQFWTTDTEYVRCAAVDGHEGLHRCHFDGQHQRAVWMWGDDREAVSIEALCATPNPLALLSPEAACLVTVPHRRCPCPCGVVITVAPLGGVSHVVEGCTCPSQGGES